MKKVKQVLNIGGNIRKLRELKDIPVKQAAAVLNMSVSGYSRIERNETDLTISRIQEIAEVLNVDIFQIFYFDMIHVPQNDDSLKVRDVLPSDNYREKYIRLLESIVLRSIK